jgi:hypothetical protein
MSAGTLRILVIFLTAFAAFLAFFLGGAQQVGLDPMVALLLGAVLAAINVSLGLLPSAIGQSGLEPGKSEEKVVRAAMAGDVPRGMA